VAGGAGGGHDGMMHEGEFYTELVRTRN
jgi:hypothetical protein